MRNLGITVMVVSLVALKITNRSNFQVRLCLPSELNDKKSLLFGRQYKDKSQSGCLFDSVNNSLRGSRQFQEANKHLPDYNKIKKKVFFFSFLFFEVTEATQLKVDRTSYKIVPTCVGSNNHISNPF